MVRRVAVVSALAVLIGGVFAVLPVTAAQASTAHCGMTVTTSIHLDSDLWMCPGNGMVVDGDNVDVDLGGHIVRGQRAGTGIVIARAASQRHVTIHDGVIQGFANGVEIGSGATLSGLRITQNSQNAIVRESGPSTDTTDVTRSYIDQNGTAFGGSTCGLGPTYDVTDNFISFNGEMGYWGGCAEGSIGVGQFTGNTIAYNRSGVSFLEFGGGNVQHNTFWHNTGTALNCQMSCSEIEFNAFIGNTGTAIFYSTLPYSQGLVTIAHNEVWGNRIGIQIAATFLGDVTVADNVITSNDYAGIDIDDGGLAAPQGTVSVLRNVVARNGIASWRTRIVDSGGAEIHDGIHIRVTRTRDIPFFVVGSNHARDNGGFGIEAFNVTDGGGNVGFHNGNPANCLGVVCYHP